MSIGTGLAIGCGGDVARGKTAGRAGSPASTSNLGVWSQQAQEHLA